MVLLDCENATRAVRSKRGMSSWERRLIANFVNGTEWDVGANSQRNTLLLSWMVTLAVYAVYFGEQTTTIAKESFHSLPTGGWYRSDWQRKISFAANHEISWRNTDMTFCGVQQTWYFFAVCFCLVLWPVYIVRSPLPRLLVDWWLVKAWMAPDNERWRLEKGRERPKPCNI